MDELWWRPTWIHGRGHQTPPNISAGEFGFVERSIPRFIDDSGGSFEVLTAQSRCTCSANKTWRVLWRARERKVSSVSSIVREVIDIIDQIYPTPRPSYSHVRRLTQILLISPLFPQLFRNPLRAICLSSQLKEGEKRKANPNAFSRGNRAGSGIKLRSNSRRWGYRLPASAISRKPERKEAGRYQ